MKFSPISLIPKQERSTTPDVFITDQYGKLPALNGDGPLTINQAVRLSKIVNGYVPAFIGNNKIISGFLISESSVYLENETGDLIINIPPGIGIIDKIIFNIPLPIQARWKNFICSIPAGLCDAKILIYFAYKDSLSNDINRPCPQPYPHYPTAKYPEDQSGFDPISICYAFYDPKTKRVVSSIWDPDESKIIINGNLVYHKEENGNVTVRVDVEDRGEIEIEGDDNIYPQQGGGFYDLSEVDGGTVESTSEDTVKVHGIRVLREGMINDLRKAFTLTGEPSSDYISVFYNGVYYYKDQDWFFNSKKQVEFSDEKIILPGRNIYIYENISENPLGYMEHVLTKSLPSAGEEIIDDALDPSSEYLVFLNGLLQYDDEYVIESKKIKIKYPKNSNIAIYKINPPTSASSSFLDLVYSGYAEDSSLLKDFEINPARKFLVFYNGLLYLEGVDYSILPNTLVMNFPMSSNKKIKIIGI